MTKHCGLSKFFLVAALFCLTFAAPQSRADDIQIGTGVLTLCWDGAICPDYPGAETNVVLPNPDDGFDHISITIAGNETGPDIDTPLLLIFGVPVQNLLSPFSDPPDPGQENTFVAAPGNIVDAHLFEGFDGSTPDPTPYPGAGVAIGSSLPTPPDYVVGFTQGQEFNIDDGGLFTDFLGLDGVAGGTDSIFVDWAKHIFDTPAGLAQDGTLADLGLLPPGDQDAVDLFISLLLGRYNGADAPCKLTGQIALPSDQCVDGFRIWIYELDTEDFGSGDTINVRTDGIPIGTLVTAYGRGPCEIGPSGRETCRVLAPPDSKIAILMPFDAVVCEPGDPTCDPPEVPEPTSMLLLGTGLLAIGRQWRKRQGSKKSTSEDQKVV